MAVDPRFIGGQITALNPISSEEPLDPSFFEVVGAQLGYSYKPIIDFTANLTRFGQVETDMDYDPRPDIVG